MERRSPRGLLITRTLVDYSGISTGGVLVDYSGLDRLLVDSAHRQGFGLCDVRHMAAQGRGGMKTSLVHPGEPLSLFDTVL
jgi:hypothetical protein